MLRILVDFNAMNKAGTHIRINVICHSELKNQLQNGQRVILFEAGDIQVEAVIEIEEYQGKLWYWGVVDWDTRQKSTE